MDYRIDAKGKRLGRVASEVAQILQGKKSASYEQNRVSKDRVYISNAEKITVTGSKAEQKMYYHHTGYMGHLREVPFKDFFAKRPTEVLREAIRNMLPKNFLNQKRLKNLIFVHGKEN